MIVCFANQCEYCRSSIVPGQRWVRGEDFDAALNGRDASYHRYHAGRFSPAIAVRKAPLGKTPVGAGKWPGTTRLRRLADTPNYWRMNDVLIFI